MAGNTIYIVYEDCHGDVSFWEDKEKAIEECKDIIMQNPFYDDDDGNRIEIIRENITIEQIEDYDFCVGYREQELNVSWA